MQIPFFCESTTGGNLKSYLRIFRTRDVECIGDGRELHLMLGMDGGEEERANAPLRSWLSADQTLMAAHYRLHGTKSLFVTQ